MTTTYEWLAEFAQRAGTLYFFLFFLAVLGSGPIKILAFSLIG